MNIPALAEDGDGRCLGCQQGLKIGVFIGRVLEMAGRTECAEMGMLEFHALHPLKILHSQGIGTGPAAFDKIHAQLVQLLGDLDLIVN